MALNYGERARFLKWVRRDSDGCWLWTGPVYPSGYGRHRVRPGAAEQGAHVIAWENVHGPVPDGLQLDHRCHTQAVLEGLCAGGVCEHRRCVNPDHLEAVTAAENTRRQDHAERRVSHCPQGHAYDERNTITTSAGARRCRACSILRKRDDRRRAKGLPPLPPSG